MLFLGDAEVSKEEALAELRRSLGGGAVRKLSAGDVGADEILEAQRNLSLLDPVAVVVVRRAGRLGKEETDRLLAALDAPEGSPPIVLWDGNVDRRRKLYQEIARRGGLREFSAPKPAEAERWLRKEATRIGASIEGGAAALLVDLLGTDLLRLRTTIEMLAVAVGEGRPVDRETIVAMVPEARSHALYELQDQLSARRVGPAVRLLREALGRGEGPEVILGALFAQLRRLLFARALRDGEAPANRRDRLVREASTPGFKADGLLDLAARMRPRDLRRAFERLAEIDLAIKRGRADAAASLEGWMIDFCA